LKWCNKCNNVTSYDYQRFMRYNWRNMVLTSRKNVFSSRLP